MRHDLPQPANRDFPDDRSLTTNASTVGDDIKPCRFSQ
jgi:hypothetical protein